ncbi:MAG: hypothetical protein ACFFAG_08915 [Promethearchaeota archaeon]
MKIVLYKDYFEKYWKKKEIEINFKGSGTEKDPILIETSKNEGNLLCYSFFHL